VITVIDLLITISIGALTGGITAAVVTMFLLLRQRRNKPVPEVIDPWVSAEIDRAAAAYAARHGRPETAGLIADKLHLLHRLGQRRGGS